MKLLGESDKSIQSTAITTVKVNAVTTPPVEQPAVNTPPVAKSQGATTNRDTSASITLKATDEDGDSLTYSLTSSPKQGSLSSFDKDSGSVVYTPKSGYTGSDSFTFTANDKSSTSNTAKVSITVNPVTSNVTVPEKEKESTLSNTTALSNTTGGSTKMHLEEAIKALESGNKDAASTQLTAAQQAISGESEQAKMHFNEGMKAFSAGDTNGTLMHLKAADEALG